METKEALILVVIWEHDVTIQYDTYVYKFSIRLNSTTYMLEAVRLKLFND